jgi:hypothetical protein
LNEPFLVLAIFAIARDLTAQLTGHDLLKAQGIALVPA